MGHNDHIDFELHDDIQELVDAGELEKGTAAHGVAQQVISGGGYDSLSAKQRHVYDTVVVPLLHALAKERNPLHGIGEEE